MQRIVGADVHAAGAQPGPEFGQPLAAVRFLQRLPELAPQRRVEARGVERGPRVAPVLEPIRAVGHVLDVDARQPVGELEPAQGAVGTAQIGLQGGIGRRLEQAMHAPAQPFAAPAAR